MEKELPNCPSCGKPMVLVRSVPRVGGLPRLNSYQCKPCGVVFTEEDGGGPPLAGRALALHETCCTLQ
jgi:transposase-like protein